MDTLTKERNSRFVRTPLAVALRANPRLIAILRVFDDHRLLPANWIHALVGGDRIGLNRRLTQLYREGLLNRETLLGPKNVYETMTYSRTEKGDRFLNEKGFEGLPHDGTHDAHQVLLDILSASIELGARNSSIELHKWKEIRDHPKTPKLPNHPFRFQVGTNPNNEKTIFLVPDGRPFFLKGQEGSILFVKELDRNTEPATTILTKLKNYQKAEDAIKARYGFKAMMLLFVTTDKTRQENILGWIKEVFPEGCKWILTHTMEDHIKLVKSSATVTTHLFDTPYLRCGHPAFYLNTLSNFNLPVIPQEKPKLHTPAQELYPFQEDSWRRMQEQYRQKRQRR